MPRRLRLCSLLVCKQDYTKTAEQMFIEVGWRMGLGREESPSTFGVDPGFFF